MKKASIIFLSSLILLLLVSKGLTFANDNNNRPQNHGFFVSTEAHEHEGGTEVSAVAKSDIGKNHDKNEVKKENKDNDDENENDDEDEVIPTETLTPTVTPSTTPSATPSVSPSTTPSVTQTFKNRGQEISLYARMRGQFTIEEFINIVKNIINTFKVPLGI